MTLSSSEPHPEHSDRIGRPHRLALSRGRFTTVISAKTRFGGHPGLLEAQAVRLTLEWLGRNAKNLSHRVVLLVDAKAILGAVAKGRSSARTIRRLVARISALTLALDISLYLLYVPSEWNPADAPSRGVAAASRHWKKVRRSPTLQKRRH